MTKKYIVQLADLVKGLPPTITRGLLKERLANFCKHNNPRFNKLRWSAYIDAGTATLASPSYHARRLDRIKEA